MSMEGLVALVTGGATGIGFATAGVLAARGMRVAITHPDGAAADAARQRLGAAAACTAALDLRYSDSVERAVSRVIGELGGIDVLINNAGVTGAASLGSVLDSPRSLVDTVIDVNVKGTFLCSQLVARHMVATRRRGSMVFVSSVGAFAAQELASLYCATKAAQVALVRSLALELAPHGIRVNGVAPGDIVTETSADMSAQLDAAGATGRHARQTPIGRRGQPHEVAEAIAYLASEQASFVTGATLVVDGGLLAW